MSRLATHTLALALVSCAVSCAGASGLPASPPGVVPESITVTSRSFASGGPIPVDFTCDGKNTSVDVSWSSPPEHTQALVVILEDPDAPSAPFTHWVVFDLRPESRSLAAGADVSSLGAKLGLNDSKDSRYFGPCPPHGTGHHYVLRVFALDHAVGLPEGAARSEVDAAMNSHVLGSGQVIGTFVH
jgi:Raf kinase inhibitor-like YbhB/YbcL family protein